MHTSHPRVRMCREHAGLALNGLHSSLSSPSHLYRLCCRAFACHLVFAIRMSHFHQQSCYFSPSTRVCLQRSSTSTHWSPLFTLFNILVPLYRLCCHAFAISRPHVSFPSTIALFPSTRVCLQRSSTSTVDTGQRFSSTLARNGRMAPNPPYCWSFLSFPKHHSRSQNTVMPQF
ncbi:hypothetical protein BC826DRAFT_631876 [Russula brevipes]|nr:hypothetical protein BC826DRAFT_631876 [Russula brevipes]